MWFLGGLVSIKIQQSMILLLWLFELVQCRFEQAYTSKVYIGLKTIRTSTVLRYNSPSKQKKNHDRSKLGYRITLRKHGKKTSKCQISANAVQMFEYSLKLFNVFSIKLYTDWINCKLYQQARWLAWNFILLLIR